MFGRLADRFRFPIDIQNFPDRNTMTEQVGFAAGCGISETDPGELLFERLLLKVKTGQRGYFQMPPFGLAGEQCGMALFDPAGLDDRWHEPIVVYNVNSVKSPFHPLCQGLDARPSEA